MIDRWSWRIDEDRDKNTRDVVMQDISTYRTYGRVITRTNEDNIHRSVRDEEIQAYWAYGRMKDDRDDEHRHDDTRHNAIIYIHSIKWCEHTRRMIVTFDRLEPEPWNDEYQYFLFALSWCEDSPSVIEPLVSLPLIIIRDRRWNKTFRKGIARKETPTKAIV